MVAMLLTSHWKGQRSSEDAAGVYKASLILPRSKTPERRPTTVEQPSGTRRRNRRRSGDAFWLTGVNLLHGGVYPDRTH